MTRIFSKIKNVAARKLANRRSKKNRQQEKLQEIERQKKLVAKKKRIAEQKKVIEKSRVSTSDLFLRKLDAVQKVNKRIFDNSEGLKAISRTLRHPNMTQRSCYDAFTKVSAGITRKYGLRFEMVEPGVVQALTRQAGNYATYDIKTKTFIMERIPHPENPKQINWHHMLRELQHEYGYFLLLQKYGSRENIPKVGVLHATHLLDQMH